MDLKDSRVLTRRTTSHLTYRWDLPRRRITPPGGVFRSHALPRRFTTKNRRALRFTLAAIQKRDRHWMGCSRLVLNHLVRHTIKISVNFSDKTAVASSMSRAATRMIDSRDQPPSSRLSSSSFFSIRFPSEQAIQPSIIERTTYDTHGTTNSRNRSPVPLRLSANQ